jgi:hypothetical protein
MTPWAADFSERTLPLSEVRAPTDARPREAIDALRAFCRGEKRIDAHAPGAAAHSSKMPE